VAGNSDKRPYGRIDRNGRVAIGFCRPEFYTCGTR